MDRMGVCRECCTCGKCSIAKDNFERADSTSIGTDWTESVGNWLIESTELVTADDNAKAIYNTVHPLGVPASVVVAQVKGETVGDQAQLLIVTDASNYLIAQLTFGDASTCGELSLLSSGGATLSTRKVPNLVAGNWYKFQACYYWPSAAATGTLSASVYPSGTLPRYVVYETSATPLKVGLGTGTVATKVHFDNFCWARHRVNADLDPYQTPDPICPECPTASLGCLWGGTTGEECAWLAESGSWNIDNTSSSNGRYRLTYANPYGSNHLSLQGTVLAYDDGDEFEFRIAVKDSATYLAARFTFDSTCGKVELIQNGTILETINVEPFQPNVTHWCCVSYDGTNLRADVSPTPSGEQTDEIAWLYRHCLTPVTADPGGVYVAVATGSITTRVEFAVEAWMAYSPSFPECPSCLSCDWDWIGPSRTKDVNGVCEWIKSGTAANFGDGIRLTGNGSYASYKGGDGGNSIVVATLSGDADGQNLRVYINDDGSAGGGAWAELEFRSSGTCYVRLSTGDTSATIARPGSKIVFVVCLTGTRLMARVADAAAYGTLGAAATGKYVTYKLLNAGGDAFFTNLQFMPASVHDRQTAASKTCYVCRGYCQACQGGDVPLAFEVDISGITQMAGDPNPDCCSNLNGVHYTDGMGSSFLFNPAGLDCESNSPVFGCTNEFYVSVVLQWSSTGLNVVVVLKRVGLPNYWYWSATLPHYNCTAISGLVLTYRGETDPGNFLYCDVSAAVVSVTAL